MTGHTQMLYLLKPIQLPVIPVWFSMTIQRYSVTPHPIDTLLTWVKSGEVAIPEIQRPFVWNSTQVRNLLDSLYHGYPVGYLIAWRNPDVRLKDGTSSSGKRILIDGQQRVTALMASLLGNEVLTKDYDKVRISIAFNPMEEKFEVLNPAIQKDITWIPDISRVFSPDTSLYDLVNEYCAQNSGADPKNVSKIIEKLTKITNNHVGVIELNSDLSIETVTEIFIRVNSAGKTLSQADFAMSKIASDEMHDGTTLRKAIDYFCHLSVAPEFYDRIRTNDKDFSKNEFFQQMAWLKNETDNLYDPSYTDMLRVAFTSKFKRGKLEDLVALLSGRNFETRQFEERIAEESFSKLKGGVRDFINETNFKRFVMMIRSGGFVDPSLIGSQNAVDFAYIVYLALRDSKMPPADIGRAVPRWFVFSMLTGRYSYSPESTFNSDIQSISERGFEDFSKTIIDSQFSDAYWENLVPQDMETSSIATPTFRVFQASQVKMNDKGFLSRDISVNDLIMQKSDLHHVYPKALLKKAGLTKGHYNQIANYVIAQSEINIAIGEKDPAVYFKELVQQCQGGPKKYGGITDIEELKSNLRAHCIPIQMLEGAMEYNHFLEERRKLMAKKLKEYFLLL